MRSVGLEEVEGQVGVNMSVTYFWKIEGNQINRG